jgi:hypothetical protein
LVVAVANGDKERADQRNSQRDCRPLTSASVRPDELASDRHGERRNRQPEHDRPQATRLAAVTAEDSPERVSAEFGCVARQVGVPTGMKGELRAIQGREQRYEANAGGVA